MKSKTSDRGKLKIGDDWNAIRIITLSQSNPLKAIAEFVENSIDARAKTVTITRGREHGEHYLSIRDDGDGVPRSPDGFDAERNLIIVNSGLRRRLLEVPPRLRRFVSPAGLQRLAALLILTDW